MLTWSSTGEKKKSLRVSRRVSNVLSLTDNMPSLIDCLVDSPSLSSMQTQLGQYSSSSVGNVFSKATTAGLKSDEVDKANWKHLVRLQLNPDSCVLVNMADILTPNPR